MPTDKKMRGLGLHLVSSIDDALQFRSWLSARRPVLAVDTETGGLEWWREPLRLVQLGDARGGWAVPWDQWGGVVAECLPSYARPMVFHNAAFDQHVLRRAGVSVPWEHVDDTSVMAHIIDSTRSRGLKSLCDRIVDPQFSRGSSVLADTMRDRGWTWRTVPIEYSGYWVYGVLDTIGTALLHEKLLPDVPTAVYALEMAVSRILWGMEERGVHIDLDYTARMHDTLSDAAEDALRAGSAHYGVDLGSAKALGEELEHLGVTLRKRTPTGQACVDADVLKDVASGGGRPAELASLVLRARTNRHFAKAYFGRILELHKDGVLHANINSLGARTARMSISKPPLQQLPSGSPLVRDAFIAPPGERLVSVDFDQVEVRLLAHFAQEPSMIAAIRGGEDLHWSAARMLYGPDATKAQRKLVKSGTFGKIYGIGTKKFAAAQGVSVAEAARFLQQYDEMFPEVPKFVALVQDVGRQRAGAGRAYVRSPLGRTHYMRPEDFDAYYKLVNYLIQGTAADVLKQQLIYLSNAGFDEYMRLPVHDEVIFQFPEEAAAELAHEATEVMQDLTTFAVPLTAEASKPMLRWGDRYDACIEGLHSACDRQFCSCEECHVPPQ